MQCILNKTVIILLLMASCFSQTWAMGNAEAGAARGKAICGACHGREGISNHPLRPNLAGLDKQYLFKQLKDYQTDQRFDYSMKAQLRGLDDQELLDLSAFFSNLLPAEANTDMNTEQKQTAEQLYQKPIPELDGKSCVSCHGLKGEGVLQEKAPRIAGQPYRYTAKQLEKYRNAFKNEKSEDQFSDNQIRRNDNDSVMRKATDILSDDDIEALSRYIQGLK